ncbi:hypothetical protein DPMN_125897 [Dreissena polymorpha]|uniref:Uncharacterized protein n=1 Tax=Dreissena polymorpha TaxID=45954 RepID=A0A9D4GZ52_DREPO|nr:hypothetical protein DPMN_125897 [Dreissena polymorpha]
MTAPKEFMQERIRKTQTDGFPPILEMSSTSQAIQGLISGTMQQQQQNLSCLHVHP